MSNSTVSKNLLIAFLSLFLYYGATERATADTTIAYPSTDAPKFTITVPDDWELTPAESEDDFFLVTGPTEAELWFRATPVESEDALKAAIDDAFDSGEEWLGENYKDVELGEITNGVREGMPFISVPGTGIYKETGAKTIFTIALFVMPNGSLAEFWGILGEDDAVGTPVAQAILDSFKAK